MGGTVVRRFSDLCSCLPVVQIAAGMQPSPIWGWFFGDATVFGLSLLPYLLTHPHIHNPVSNTKNWFKKLELLL